MKIVSDIMHIQEHLDTAVCIAIQSDTVFNLEDLMSALRRLWDERSKETSQA